MLLSAGMLLKNFSKASRPPAEAPMPTVRKGRSSGGAVVFTGVLGAVALVVFLRYSGLFAMVRLPTMYSSGHYRYTIGSILAQIGRG
jgi:hypothetical protein